MAASVIELAQQVLEQATAYQNFFTEKGLPAPSFEADAFPEPELPPDIVAARKSILASSKDLQDLVRGPIGIVKNAGDLFPHFLAVQALHSYNLAAHVPAEGSISYSELGDVCGLRASDLKRIVRYLLTCHIFCEPEAGRVAHNGASKGLAGSPLLLQWLGVVTEEFWPAAARTIDAMQKWPSSDEPTQSGFQLAHRTEKPLFNEITSEPRRAKRFAEGMSLFSNDPGMEPSHVIEAYPWSALNDGKAFTFVDVGGSLGVHSIALARSVPQATCVVQDLPRMIAKTHVPEDIEGRITFAEHDFFTPQKLQADVYFFRWIFHDWADSYAVKILQALVPALKQGARILLNEFCLTEPGQLPSYHEQAMRSMDLAMLAIQNSKERGLDDWKQLFYAADPRYRFQEVRKLSGSPLALIEFVWSP